MNAVEESVRSDWRPMPRLSAWQKVALAGEIVASYARVRYALIHHPSLPQTLSVLRRPPREPKRPEGRTPLEAGVRLGHAVRRTLALVPADSRCLMRSLVLVSLLSRRGIPGSLVIGVRTRDGKFDAHAWVEHEGRALLHTGHDFTRLGEF